MKFKNFNSYVNENLPYHGLMFDIKEWQPVKTFATTGEQWRDDYNEQVSKYIKCDAKDIMVLNSETTTFENVLKFISFIRNHSKVIKHWISIDTDGMNGFDGDLHISTNSAVFLSIGEYDGDMTSVYISKHSLQLLQKTANITFN